MVRQSQLSKIIRLRAGKMRDQSLPAEKLDCFLLHENLSGTDLSHPGFAKSDFTKSDNVLHLSFKTICLSDIFQVLNDAIFIHYCQGD
jgi:hypothetical protein